MVDEWTERRIANRRTSAISLVNASPQRQKHEKPRPTITGASSIPRTPYPQAGRCVKYGVVRSSVPTTANTCVPVRTPAGVVVIAARCCRTIVCTPMHSTIDASDASLTPWSSHIERRQRRSARFFNSAFVVALQAANTVGKRGARNRQRHRCGKQHRLRSKQSEYIAIHEPVPRLALIKPVYHANQGWRAQKRASRPLG